MSERVPVTYLRHWGKYTRGDHTTCPKDLADQWEDRDILVKGRVDLDQSSQVRKDVPKPPVDTSMSTPPKPKPEELDYHKDLLPRATRLASDLDHELPDKKRETLEEFLDEHGTGSGE